MHTYTRMKTMILLVLFHLCIQYIYCDDLLSKFHQNSYRVRDFRASLMSYSEKYFNKLEVKTFKYNRTTPAVNATVNIKSNIIDKVEVLVQSYKFLSNEYRHFPLRFEVNLVKAIKSNIAGVLAIKNCGNITGYLEENVTYHVCNFVIDETHLPPLIPSGRYKADLRVLYLDEEIAVLYGYGEIYTPTVYPKK